MSKYKMQLTGGKKIVLNRWHNYGKGHEIGKGLEPILLYFNLQKAYLKQNKNPY